MSADWKSFQNDPLEELAPNLWRVEGALPKMSLRRQMIIVRTDSGQLLIHNAICSDDETQRQIEALGSIRWIAVPNAFHRIDAARYKARYPEAKIICPRGARRKVEQRVAVDATYDELDLEAPISVEHVRGIKETEGVFKVESPDGMTLVFNDIVFNQPHLPGFFGVVYRLMGSSGRPKVTLVAKLAFAKDKAALREHLRQLAALPNLKRVVPAHIDVIDQNAGRVLAEIADTV